MYRALIIDKAGDAQQVELRDVDENTLPSGDVTVAVEYSTLNYKDALAITGSAPIIRSYPMVPGIDFSGEVIETTNNDYRVGQKVILNGWGVGESHPGGYAEKARLDGGWLVPLPDAFDTRSAMAVGTAGYTAMLCVLALERHGVTPEKGEIVVTGASGGVGSVAVAVLSKLGYKVVAVTGRSSETEYLLGLGASEVIDRQTLSEPGRPLAKERWAGAVDTVGSTILANICAQTKYHGVVAATGLAGGSDFPATVMPFILRGITLQGVDSVTCPREQRIKAWDRLARDLDLQKLGQMTSEIGLSEVITAAGDLLNGKLHGRVVVDVPR